MKEKIESSQVLKRLIKILTDMLQTSRGETTSIDEKSARKLDIFSDLGLDSVEVMDLLALIEGEFDIKVETEKVIGKKKIGEFEEIIQNCLREVQ